MKNKKSIEMSKKAQKKEISKKVSKKTKSNNILFFTLAAIVATVSFIFLPNIIARTGFSPLDSGAGLNKLLSTVITIGLGWVVLMPSDFFKKTIVLAKGARNEWRKSIKPGKDEVLKTTMTVLVIVILSALLIVALDFAFFSAFKSFLGG